MAEVDDGEALLAHARGCIGAEDVGHVPALLASLAVLLNGRF
ncbi:MAG TPA: hypothetical protein VNI58_00085 [Mariprofundaceae bacterium]|nr:hypothetical protein [Mariprofundaceae bacterium]